MEYYQIITKENLNKMTKVKIKRGDNVIVTTGKNKGSKGEVLEVIKKEGKDMMIGFDPKFLIDALKVIDDEEIDIYLVNPKAPCFIRDKDSTYIYLVLPVNFTTVD